MKKKLCQILITVPAYFCFISPGMGQNSPAKNLNTLYQQFITPPASAKPGVYWYFMDGNMSKSAITEDLESMHTAGIAHLVFLEVNVGVPRGKIDFLSEEWQDLFRHAVRESERLGITITLGVGPGWTGSGGPWVKPEQSMQHLVATSQEISGPVVSDISLKRPVPKPPFFGEEGFTQELQKRWKEFYRDVVVLAFPTPLHIDSIANTDYEALYYRAPYSSQAGVPAYIPSSSSYPASVPGSTIDKRKILDVTKFMRPDGRLQWKVPAGHWTIMRFGITNNGAVTRPAPIPGVGFESDKFDTAALNAHFAQYTGKLFDKIGRIDSTKEGGLKVLHMDSWEMGAQNWSANFRKEFIRRRGYDPQPFFPVYTGLIVESREKSERFLWDLRQTGQELVVENHANQIKRYSHRRGLKLSIEPYDMNPAADIELGAVADIPMCEFWSRDFGIPSPGFTTAFSSMEASSIAHLKGISLVRAEAFTSAPGEGWKQYPASMKDQGDWAFAAGINQFFFHTFAHQELNDSLRPGMTMGPYGVHWDRNQTWWPLVNNYHNYLTRCGFLLQQGRTVADVLYLTPEGAPQVFTPPPSALAGDYIMPDRKGYNFDGCSPGLLYEASVKDHQIVFPGAASYRLLVLPDVSTMTPLLLKKISALVSAGATVVGLPPVKSPGLSGYPQCDAEVNRLAKTLWGNTKIHAYGKGKMVRAEYPAGKGKDTLYPDYAFTSSLLAKENLEEDFSSAAPLRYTHRTSAAWDIYFVSNRSDFMQQTEAVFRSVKGAPVLWDAVTGEKRPLHEFSVQGKRTTIPLRFEPYQSYFIVFEKNDSSAKSSLKNFPDLVKAQRLEGPWSVSFDSTWGGPTQIIFDSLTDWTKRPEKNIRYYSGTAVYRKKFEYATPVVASGQQRLFLDLGEVRNIARVKLNGQDLGIVWTSPWKLDVTGKLRERDNALEIEVINLWPNRLIGDEFLPDDGVKDGAWPEWLTKGTKRTSGRFTFTTYHHYNKESPLLSSGLTGPVTVRLESY